MKGDPEEVFSASLSSFVIVWSRVVIITGISLLHIWKGYHTEVLKDVTAELPSTGLVLLTGPSGCGKTTLSHLILGLIKPDRVVILLSLFFEKIIVRAIQFVGERLIRTGER